MGWHWLIKVCSFQLYNSIIHHLYIVLCVYHPASSLCHHFSPFTLSHLPHPLPLVITILFVFMRIFVFLNPLTIFTHLPKPHSFWQLSVCSLCLWICLYFVCLFIMFTRFPTWVKWYCICLSLTVLFHLTQYSPGPSKLWQKVRFPILQPQWYSIV